MILQPVCIYFIVDAAFSCYHFFIDCFEIEGYALGEVSASKIHHEKPWERAHDTPLRIQKMAIPAIVAAGTLVYGWKVYLGRANEGLSLYGSTIAYALGYLAFVNHKYVHHRYVPRPLQILQQSGLLMNREYHQIHHNAEDGQHFGFLKGWIDKPLAVLYQNIPPFYRLLVPFTGLLGLSYLATYVI